MLGAHFSISLSAVSLPVVGLRAELRVMMSALSFLASSENIFRLLARLFAKSLVHDFVNIQAFRTHIDRQQLCRSSSKCAGTTVLLLPVEPNWSGVHQRGTT